MKDGVTNSDNLSFLRGVSSFVVMAGAIGSVAFTLHAGRSNHSFLLPVLFVVWVVSPFILLLVANVVFTGRWTVRIRAWIYILTLIITITSSVIYSGVLTPSGIKPAAVFLMVPLISWIFIATAYLIIKGRKRK